jgi:threonine/homoserine/homoserine lactone efflux protein
MDVKLLVAGIATGLALSVPIGAVNLIVIRTALNTGWRPAFVAGLGAVASDVVMATVAALGLSSVAQGVMHYAFILELLGGILLVIVGIRSARTHVNPDDLRPTPHASRLGLTFSLSITNPGVLLGFFAIFGSMQNVLQLGYGWLRGGVVVLGVALGGIIWWLFLSLLISYLGSKLGPQMLDRISRWSGVLVAAFGFALLMQPFT